MIHGIKGKLLSSGTDPLVGATASQSEAAQYHVATCLAEEEIREQNRIQDSIVYEMPDLKAGDTYEFGMNGHWLLHR